MLLARDMHFVSSRFVSMDTRKRFVPASPTRETLGGTMEIGFRRTSISLIVGLLFVLSATLAVGQGIVTGSISGTVEDQQHAVVAGANVSATNTATNQQVTATSNSQGFFTVRGLPPGTYNVTIEAPKFSRVKINDVVVNSNRDTALGSRSLSIGAAEVV